MLLDVLAPRVHDGDEVGHPMASAYTLLPCDSADQEDAVGSAQRIGVEPA